MIYSKYENEEIKHAFAKSLKTIRKYVGYSLLDLEKVTGINNPSLSRYENGRVEPSISQAVIIAETFELTIEDFLIYGLNEKPENTDSETIIERFNENISNLIFQNGENAKQLMIKCYPKLDIDEIYKYYH